MLKVILFYSYQSLFERLLLNNVLSRFIVKKQKMVEHRMQRVWG